MTKISIKPLSVNEAYRGRRFATKELKQYKKDLARLLPKMEVPKGKLMVRYTFGVSSKAADYDNLIKTFQDAMAEKYGFNDNRIYRGLIIKQDVPRGEEFIEFELSPIGG